MGQCYNSDDGGLPVVNDITKYNLENEDGVVITGKIFEIKSQERKNNNGFITFVTLWNVNHKIIMVGQFDNIFKRGDDVNMLCMQMKNGQHIAKQVYHVNGDKLYKFKIKIRN